MLSTKPNASSPGVSLTDRGDIAAMPSPTRELAGRACALAAAALLAAAGALPGGTDNGPKPSPAPEAHAACRMLAPFAAAGQMVVPFPTDADLQAGEVIAYEENIPLTYVVLDLAKAYGPAGQGKPGAGLLRRILLLKPSTFLIDDQVRPPAGTEQVRWRLLARGAPKVAGREVTLADKAGTLVCQTLLPRKAVLERTAAGVDVLAPAGPGDVRLLQLIHLGDAETAPQAEVEEKDGTLKVTVSGKERVYHLSLPKGRIGGDIKITRAQGKVVLPRRVLASGILPSGKLWKELLESYDAPYRRGNRPPFDTGRPEPELIKLVEQGVIRPPARVVDIGCGSGNNAVYLAQKGFDVTGIDIAPSALKVGEDLARKAGVKVRWVLASVLEEPLPLEAFDILLDRGTYHGLRKIGGPQYIKTARRYSRPGSQFVLMATDRISLQDMHDDFDRLWRFEKVHEFTFDRQPTAAVKTGHVVIMRRKDPAAR
jgi:hypothetical protein